MSQERLQRVIAIGGVLTGLGVIVELLSFTWAHPLAFVMFGVVGGGLVAVGALLFVVAAFRSKAWLDPIEPSE